MFGIIGAIAAALFVCVVTLTGHRAWLRSRREHLKQLEAVRDRQELQGEESALPAPPAHTNMLELHPATQRTRCCMLLLLQSK